MKVLANVLVIFCLLLMCVEKGVCQANTCASAEVLCSLNELDGFTGSMPQSNNTGEFPNGGLCPGGGTNQNITWFAFIAGSTDASLNLITSNCQGGIGGNPAIQYGIYTDCNFTEAVICVSAAVPVGNIPINITGLQPGDDYFFFIDGDAGSYCDFEIEVVSGGDAVDLSQPSGIDCVSADCPIAGGSACLSPLTLTFEVAGIDLSIDYIWTVTPSPPVGTTVVGSNQNTFTFDNAGTYEICVVADNGCTATAPVCYDLVIDPPDAGSLSAAPAALCPGDFSTVVVTGYNMDPGLSQAVIAVDPDDVVVGVASGDMLDFTYDMCGTVTVYSYNFNPTDSPVPPGVGSFYIPPPCTNTCCDIESIQVVFEDTDPPAFLNAPQDLDVLCEQDVPAIGEATWNDNCSGTGTVEGTEVNNTILCQGGTITRTWVFVDGCGNPAVHTQFINVSTGVDVPAANDVNIQLCLSGSANDTIILSSLNDQVNTNDIFDFRYYASLSDANSGTDQLNDIYIVNGATTLFVTVTNECDCRVIGEINIIAAPAPSYEVVIDDVTCLDSMDGSIMISNLAPIGTLVGFGDLDYTDSLTYDSLAGGTYVINTIAPEGCTGSDTIVINEGQELTFSDLSLICNTNGTATDSNDDFFDVTITVANSTSATSNVTILANGALIGSFPYGNIVFTLPTGPSQNIVIIDEVTGCDVSFNTSVLSPCSDDCIVQTDSLSFICDNGGTLGIPEDDVYTLTFVVSVINSMSAEYVFIWDSTAIGTYAYSDTITIETPADSAVHELIFMDAGDSTCFLLLTSPALLPCSGECTLEVVAEATLCDALGTTLDSLDDVFTAEVVINIETGSGQWIIVETGATGASGDMVTVGPYLISDGDQVLTVQDLNIPSCTDTILLTAPAACSECLGAVEAGADWLLTCSLSEADLSGVAVPAVVGSWSGPNGFLASGNDVQVDVPGTYYFTADYGDDCILTDSLVVELSNDIPQVTDLSPQTLTCFVDSVILAATVLGGSSNLEYRWLDMNMGLISNSEELVVFLPGTYFLVIYDIDTDCTTPATAVTVSDETADLSPQINASPGFILDCVVDEVTVQIIEEPNITYDWFVGNVLISGVGTQLTVSEAATIRVEATNTVTGCTGEATIVIADEIGYPIVFIDTADTLDCQVETITLDGSGSQMGSTIGYTWLDADSTVVGTDVPVLEVAAAGIYYLQLIDEDNSCINWDTVEVFSNIELPEVQLVEAVSIPCDEEQTVIALSVSNNSYAIEWSTDIGLILGGADGTEVTAGAEGLYIVEVTNPENQCSTLDTVMVSTFDQLTDLQTTIENESCEGSGNATISIGNIAGGLPPYTYELDGLAAATEQIENLSAGTYVLLVTDANGCTFESTVDIVVDEPLTIDLVPEVTIVQNESGQLTASVDIDRGDIGSILWSPSEGLSCDSCLTTTVTAGLEDVVYTVGITDIYGCYAEATVTVISKQVLVVTTPNVMRIDGSNGNSNFTIYTSIPASISELSIYDRWGNAVYKVSGIPTNDPALGWNGNYSNKPIAQGVYMYTYTLISEEGETVTKSGDITILR